MIGQLDQAALMSYRNFAAGEGGILDLVKEEIASSDQLGKQIVVGVETLRNTEASYLSFYEPGAAKMQQELSVVDSTLNGHLAMPVTPCTITQAGARFFRARTIPAAIKGLLTTHDAVNSPFCLGVFFPSSRPRA